MSEKPTIYIKNLEPYFDYPEKLQWVFDKTGVKTLNELADMSETDLKKYRGVGATRISMVMQVLAKHGMKLKSSK